MHNRWCSACIHSCCTADTRSTLLHSWHSHCLTAQLTPAALYCTADARSTLLHCWHLHSCIKFLLSWHPQCLTAQLTPAVPYCPSDTRSALLHSWHPLCLTTQLTPAGAFIKRRPAVIIIIIIKKGRQCKAEREWCTPYQSEDPSPTIPTYRQKEEKGKKSRRLYIVRIEPPSSIKHQPALPASSDSLQCINHKRLPRLLASSDSLQCLYPATACSACIKRHPASPASSNSLQCINHKRHPTLHSSSDSLQCLLQAIVYSTCMKRQPALPSSSFCRLSSVVMCIYVYIYILSRALPTNPSSHRIGKHGRWVRYVTWWQIFIDKPGQKI